MPVRPRKKSSVPKKVDALSAAKLAVEEFEAEHTELVLMQDEFAEKFSEANIFLENIKLQEDLVQSKIAAAIPLIREAKQNVGDFKCQLKKSKPCYDDKEFMSLVTQIEEGGDILINLIDGGYIKKVSLDPSAAGYFSQHPAEAEHFQSAWREARDMTPAITPPKL